MPPSPSRIGADDSDDGRVAGRDLAEQDAKLRFDLHQREGQEAVGFYVVGAKTGFLAEEVGERRS
jgi:hypothetical protein